MLHLFVFFFFQAEDGIRDPLVTGVQTCAFRSELANPISEEASIMRTSMVPGMLNMLAYNLNRGVDNVRLFEVGHVFQAVDRGAAELKSISLGATGSAIPPSWNQASRPISFFDLKGDIDTLLRAFHYDAIGYDSQTPE